MDRPYIVCHTVSSIDGKVTGDFLFREECAVILQYQRKKLTRNVTFHTARIDK